MLFMKKNAHFSFSNQKIDNNLFELERNFKHFKDFDYYFEYTMFQNEVKLYVNEAKLSESIFLFFFFFSIIILIDR